MSSPGAVPIFPNPIPSLPAPTPASYHSFMCRFHLLDNNLLTKIHQLRNCKINIHIWVIRFLTITVIAFIPQADQLPNRLIINLKFRSTILNFTNSHLMQYMNQFLFSPNIRQISERLFQRTANTIPLFPVHHRWNFVSRFTTSSKSVILLRPLTCHSPVIPGRNAMRARWWDSYFSHSSIVGGLVPTRLISPPYVKPETTFRTQKKSLWCLVRNSFPITTSISTTKVLTFLLTSIHIKFHIYHFLDKTIPSLLLI